jgi:hypothetical protein
MTQAAYNGSSPYASTPQVVNHLPYLDFWDTNTVVLVSPTDQYYTVPRTYQHRPDLLSYDLYGTTGYWWVFAMRNPDVIQDPIYDMVAGISIYLPAQSSLPLGGG